MNEYQKLFCVNIDIPICSMEFRIFLIFDLGDSFVYVMHVWCVILVVGLPSIGLITMIKLELSLKLMVYHISDVVEAIQTQI